ncbi:MAG: hypothetical protein DDT42_02114 [candidate division WS2 bacterium]|uniref:Uncharacterized protein n=1 Tax=Psychracetigena formicireducens TaxID=2986056 RepID=A0A9E2F2W4_PSYF1|nr:hypothetical protein [Candidatus Psychracetigena formicireducens]
MKNKNSDDDLYRALGCLEGKIDVGFKNIIDRLDKINGTNDKHENRINKIENKISTSDGKVAGVAFIISFIVSVIGIFWKYFSR